MEERAKKMAVRTGMDGHPRQVDDEVLDHDFGLILVGRIRETKDHAPLPPEPDP
jgi:hypothetical protein